MTNLTFWQLLSVIFAMTFGAIAVKISLAFDVNKFLETRRKTNSQKVKNACTHMELIPADDGRLEVRSFFVSPPGTLQWQCQRCGLIKYLDGGEVERMADFYIKNPEEYNRRNKRFVKLLKRSGVA